MNFLNRTITFLILGGTLTVLSDLAKADGSISNFNLQVCNSARTKCLIANSANAETGDLKPIYFLNHVDIELTSFDKQLKYQDLRDQKGYVDFANDQMVLRQVEKDGSLNERVFNLSTLNESVLKTK